MEPVNSGVTENEIVDTTFKYNRKKHYENLLSSVGLAHNNRWDLIPLSGKIPKLNNWQDKSSSQCHQSVKRILHSYTAFTSPSNAYLTSTIVNKNGEVENNVPNLGIRTGKIAGFWVLYIDVGSEKRRV